MYIIVELFLCFQILFKCYELKNSEHIQPLSINAEKYLMRWNIQVVLGINLYLEKNSLAKFFMMSRKIVETLNNVTPQLSGG